MRPEPVDERRCRATNRAGGRCRKYATPGAAVCSMHGSNAPQVRRKARERLLDQKAAQVVARTGGEPVDDPAQALSDFLGEVIAFKDYLGALAAQLRSLTITDRQGRQEVAAILAAYERAQDRTGRLLVDVGRLGLDERRVRITEIQVGKLLEATEKMLAHPDIALGAAQQQRARELLSIELRGPA